MNNSRLNKLSLLRALAFNSFLAFFVWTNADLIFAQENVTFKLYGNGHNEDSVGAVAEGLGYNVTMLESLGNGTTIVVEATSMLQEEIEETEISQNGSDLVSWIIK